MLVIISDLHLTDGTNVEATSPDTFGLFAERLQELALAASWRADGRYEPLRQIDLVLLGDVIDLIRSTQWRQQEVYPWNNADDDPFINTLSRIVDGVMDENQQALTMLRGLAVDGAIRLPQASSAGVPIYNVQTQPAPVRTLYMAGNHDWPLHLGGAAYDLLRKKLTHHLGLGNHQGQPFPHDPLESEQLLETFRRHRVLARHGDIFDPLNFAEDRDVASLGDALTIHLADGFFHQVEQSLGDDLPQPALYALREMSHVRPLLCTPMWIESLLQRTCPYPHIRKQIKHIWDERVEEFLELEFVRRQDAGVPFDLVDGLAGALKFSRKLSRGWAARITNWLHTIRGADDQSYACHALAEQDFRNRRARHIVYGHTHQYEMVPLDASYADDLVLNQVYFNSGAWRRTYRQTHLQTREGEFIPCEQMTILTFYQGDERGGRPYETWHGCLGVESKSSPQKARRQVERDAPHPIHDGPHTHHPSPQFRRSSWGAVNVEQGAGEFSVQRTENGR